MCCQVHPKTPNAMSRWMVMATERRCSLCRDAVNSSLCSHASVQPMEANRAATPAILSHGSGIRIASTVLPGHLDHCVCLLSQQVRHYVAHQERAVGNIGRYSPCTFANIHISSVIDKAVQTSTCTGGQFSRSSLDGCDRDIHVGRPLPLLFDLYRFDTHSWLLSRFCHTSEDHIIGYSCAGLGI